MLLNPKDFSIPGKGNSKEIFGYYKNLKQEIDSF